MCLITFAHRVNDKYPLILSANRDEFFSRKSREAQFWKDEAGCSNLLAGKDLVAGGTWIGVTKDGKFAAITNLRSNPGDNQASLSRGALTLEYLTGKESPLNFAKTIVGNLSSYRGFNLLLGNEEEIVFINSKDKSILPLEPGVYAFSNGTLNSNYSKVVKGKDNLTKLINTETELNPDLLIDMMRDRTTAADNSLPSTILSKALEKKLSSIFVSDTNRNYGTLCTTAFVTNSSGKTQFIEQNYDELGQPTRSHYFEYSQSSVTN
ncbi:MAG: NRDE family protein [Pseudohongiellaceae bacterium]